jgi:hypothetical protein
MIKKTKTAFKAIVAIALFASVVAMSCNNDKKSENTTTTTDTGAGHPVTPVNKTGGDTDTGAGHPVTPVNKDATPPPPPAN